MRYTPFETMERLFDDLRREPWATQGDWSGRSSGRGGRDLAVDLTEHEGEYVLTADLPGFEREEIDLRFDDGALVVAASREVSDEGATRRRSVHERVRVPAAVVEDEIAATYRNGVLEVHLPVRDDVEDRGRRIDVD